MAAVRVGLGLVIVLDLCLRARHLTAFYTDGGVLPRATLAAVRPGFAEWSLHAIAGGVWLQVILFAAAGVAGLALAAGVRPRLAAVCSVLLLASLHLRNPVVLNAGDSLLRRLLLWGTLLPLGARWSLGAARSEAVAGKRDDTVTDERIASVATAGVLVQVVVVYATNAVVKLRGSVWSSGRAVRYVFELERFTTPIGAAIAGRPALLAGFDWLWLGLVTASPALLLLTGRRRSVLAAGLIGGHLGMALTMRLGVFPLVSVVSLLPFLDSRCWDRVERAGRWLDARVRLLDRPAATPDGGRRLSGRLRAVGRRAGRLAAIGLLAFVVVWNAAAVGAVEVGASGPVSPGENRWDMFAPSPPREAAWFTAPAVTRDGRTVDASPGDRLADGRTSYPSVRWRKYLVSIWWADETRLQHGVAERLCTRWDQTHEGQLDRLSLVVTTEPTRFDGPESRHQETLVTHQCSG